MMRKALAFVVVTGALVGVQAVAALSFLGYGYVAQALGAGEDSYAIWWAVEALAVGGGVGLALWLASRKWGAYGISKH